MPALWCSVVLLPCLGLRFCPNEGRRGAGEGIGIAYICLHLWFNMDNYRQVRNVFSNAFLPRPHSPAIILYLTFFVVRGLLNQFWSSWPLWPFWPLVWIHMGKCVTTFRTFAPPPAPPRHSFAVNLCLTSFVCWGRYDHFARLGHFGLREFDQFGCTP